MATIPKRALRGLLCTLIALLCLTPLAPSATLANTNLVVGGTARVANANGQGVYLRSDVGYNASIVTLVSEGTVVQVLEGPFTAADGTLWYHLGVWDQVGFMVHNYLIPEDGAPEAQPIADPLAEPEPAAEGEVETQTAVAINTGTIVGTNGANVRCRIEAGYHGEVITALPEGTIVEIIGEVVVDWQPVNCGGRTGFIHSDFVFIEGVTPPDTEAAQEVEVDAEAEPAPEPALAVEPEVEATEEDSFGAESFGTSTVTGTATVSGTNGGGLRCRSDASFEASVVAVLSEGTEVALRGDAVGEWQPVVCAEQNGFVHSSFITIAGPSNDESTEAPASTAVDSVSVSGSAIVTGTGGGGLRCRSDASYNAGTITILAEGSTVSLRGNAVGEWQPVVCAGQNGYAHTSFLTTSGSGGSGTGSGSGNGGGSTITGTAVVSGTGGAGLRCRAEAGYHGAVLAVVPEGITVELRGSMSGAWQPVICAKQNGFVHGDFLSFGGSGNGGSGNGNNGGSNGGGGGSTITGTAVVSGTGGAGLRCRSDASTNASTITVMAEGTSVSLRGSLVGDWQPVVCAGQNGFAHNGYLSAGGGGNTNPGSGSSGSNNGNSSGLSNGDHARTTANLNLRYNPSYSAGVAAVAPAGTVVQITGNPSSGFYPVNWDGLNGYMYGDYLVWTDQALSKRGGSGNPSNPGGNPGGGGGSSTGNAIVNYAMQYQGYPYVWATAGPSSFDCSGFTYWVILNVLGIDIGRGLWTQIAAGTAVSYGNLQPGDLVFFQNTYTWGLSHVGIYIGNNQFIHAENPSTGVRISDLTSQYYSSRYYGARRMG